MSEETYECKVIESGFVAGEYHEKGEILNLTSRQKRTGLARERIEEVIPAPQKKKAEIKKPSNKETPAKPSGTVPWPKQKKKEGKKKAVNSPVLENPIVAETPDGTVPWPKQKKKAGKKKGK
ncbi:hypothetical protein N8Z76_00295 [Gammaproteobacteria bacterium]|nr:hypothetical protein [Gammaproteobacteria bacterium]